MHAKKQKELNITTWMVDLNQGGKSNKRPWEKKAPIYKIILTSNITNVGFSWEHILHSGWVVVECSLALSTHKIVVVNKGLSNRLTTW
jgi:hypothetical protein